MDNVLGPAARTRTMISKDDEENIMKGLGSASKKLAEDSSDSNSKEYEFQEEQKQTNLSQKNEDFTTNKWRSLKSLNPQGMHMNDCLNICLEKGIDVTENTQKNDIRVLESKERAKKGQGKGKERAKKGPRKGKERAH
jgi:hypothetical protein